MTGLLSGAPLIWVDPPSPYTPGSPGWRQQGVQLLGFGRSLNLFPQLQVTVVSLEAFKTQMEP